MDLTLQAQTGNLAESIRLHREALQRPSFTGRDLAHRAHVLHNLANALRRRYILTGSEEDLDEQIRTLRDALELRPPNHPLRDISLNYLAAALGDRYSQTGSEDDLTESIRLLADALEICPLGHPLRSTSLNSLVVALRNRYSQTCLEDDLAEITRLLREVLAHCPPGHPHHAAALMDLAQAMWLSTNAPSKADEVFLLLKEGSTDLIAPWNDSLECAHKWVTLAREIHHSTLGDAYDQSIRHLKRYLTVGPTVKLQYEALTRQAGILSLPMDAAAHSIQNGDVGRAVEMLDEGRFLLWTEMQLRSHKPLLRSALVGEELAVAFEATCSELRHISTAEAGYDSMPPSGRLGQRGPDSLLHRKRKLLREYDWLLALIRKKWGLEDFLRRRPFKKLQEAAKEGPIIIVNCSEIGSHVIIVFPTKSPTVITLDEDFYNKAVNIHELYLNALHVTNHALNASRALNHKLKHITRHLWDLVVSKVVHALDHQQKRRSITIHWSDYKIVNCWRA